MLSKPEHLFLVPSLKMSGQAARALTVGNSGSANDFMSSARRASRGPPFHEGSAGQASCLSLLILMPLLKKKQTRGHTAMLTRRGP